MKQSETHIIFVLIFLFYYKISNPTSWLQILIMTSQYSEGLIFSNYSLFGGICIR